MNTDINFWLIIAMAGVFFGIVGCACFAIWEISIREKIAENRRQRDFYNNVRQRVEQ